MQSKAVQRFLADCESFTNQVLVPKQSAREWLTEGAVFMVIAFVFFMIL